VTADGDIELRNQTDYDVDLTDLPALTLDMQSEDPVVLIFHTHTSEDYGGETGLYRAQDLDSGVTAVGEVLAETLEARGYGVVHDQTYCDYPQYNGAYSRSRQVIQAALEEYPSIRLVIDLHRDAVEDSQGEQLAMSLDQDTAQVMLVVGSDAGGLDHPLWRQNLALAAALQARMETLCPGIMRPVDLRTERFNQDLGEMALLVEIGASGNTLDQAKQAAVWLGNGLSDIFDQSCGENS
jgi:stage II sporulation protein P